MAEPTLTLLHLSDLHVRSNERSAWRRRRVFGDTWKANLDALCVEGPYDLVCFTGDVAFAGQPLEYEEATKFFQSVLERLGLGWDRFFPIPGNHDIDRKISPAPWKRLRDKLPRASRPEVSSWLVGGPEPLGFKNRERAQVLERQAAYRRWAQDLGRPELDPVNSPHGLLGYRQTLSLSGLPFPIHILGLDSAWACGDDHDAGKLWLTDEQVMRLATDARGESLDGLRLALVHHPFDELADGSEVRRLLAERVDLVLRGHLHEAEAQVWADPERTLRQIAAGCLYEHDRYPNACERIRIVLDGSGRPLRHEVRFRGWSPRGFWFDDNSLYSGTVDGRLTLWVGERPSPPSADPRVAQVFIGREPELERLAASLLGEGSLRPVAICSVQGMPGVGKSYLAERFAYLHQDRFPGGVWRLVLERSGAPVTGESLLGGLADRLRASPVADGLAERVRDRLLSPRSLLHIENVDAEPLARAAAELIRRLAGCPVLVTGRYQALGEALGWIQVPVRPLDEATALAQLAEELGEQTREETAAYQRLVRALGFLPLAVHLAAGYLKAGHSVEGFLTRLRQTGFTLPAADVAESVLTRDQSRKIIASTFTLSLDGLKAQLGSEGERLAPCLINLGHAPHAGFGASLGAAISGLSAFDFEQLAVAAQRLSVLDPIPPAERRDRAYRLHPLLAELLRAKGDEESAERAHAQMTEWFCARLPELPTGNEEEQGKRWREIQAETGALTLWLADVRETEGLQIRGAGSRFATLNGPFHAWLRFCEELLCWSLGDKERSGVLWTLSQVAFRSGNLDRAAAVARDKVDLDRARGDERGAALAAGVLADVLQERGELDEALRIRHEEEIPVYEQLDDARERAVAMGKVADVLQAHGELDESLRIRREEQLPIYERLRDLRMRAMTMGKIANLLQARGGELDEVLRIRREEEIPVYEQLGDMRARAVTMGQIADVLRDQGDLEESLRIVHEEELPAYERLGLGASRDLLVARANLAITHLIRNHAGDRETAIELLNLALEAAERMRIPEAEQIRSLLQEALDMPQPETAG